MKALAAAVLLAAGVQAQAFTDLATTTDGSALYFASPLRLKNTTELIGAQKIFRAAGGQVTIAASPACDVTPGPPPQGAVCGLLAPEVSGNGGILAYTFQEYDPLGSTNILRGVVAQPFFVHPVNGHVHISRNGRYALGDPGIIGLPLTFDDLSNGASTTFTGFSVIGDGRQSIADDGTVVLRDTTAQTVLWKNGTVTPLRLDHHPGNARMDRDAHHIIYEWIDTQSQWINSQYHLNSYDIATGVDTQLWVEGQAPPTLPPFVPSPLYYQPSLSDDGSHVLIQAAFLSPDRTKDLWIVATDGTNARQLTARAAVAWDVLSGDGMVAYATTVDNRILRVNTVTVDRTEVVPRTPIIAAGGTAPSIAPGDYATVGGGGLEGVTVLVNSEPAYVIAAHNGLVAFRIPWDVAVNAPASISVVSDSPFEGPSVSALVQASSPHPWISSPIHQDFSGFVTNTSPAHAGEVLHLYMTGLGITDPMIGLDQPAPIGTLFRAVTPLSCSVAGINAPVFFAGVAPGQTWIYQVDVEIPNGAATGTLNCGGAPFPLFVQ